MGDPTQQVSHQGVAGRSPQYPLILFRTMSTPVELTRKRNIAELTPYSPDIWSSLSPRRRMWSSASRGNRMQPASQLASSSWALLCVRNDNPLCGAMNIMDGSRAKSRWEISCAKLLFVRVLACDGFRTMRCLLPSVTVMADQE